MKRLRGVGIVCLALGVVILLSAIFATALGARVGALGAWMDEARAAQAEVSALNAQSDSALSAARKAGTAQSRAQSAMETAQEAIAAVDEGIAALESGAMDDQALSALNAALQEAQVSLASSEESVELLGSILGSLMGEGGALQNALDGNRAAGRHVAIERRKRARPSTRSLPFCRSARRVQSMLLHRSRIAEPLEELRGSKTWMGISGPAGFIDRRAEPRPRAALYRDAGRERGALAIFHQEGRRRPGAGRLRGIFRDACECGSSGVR